MTAMIRGVDRIPPEIKPTKQIKYSANWNGKLHCRYHTTIRLSKGYYLLCDYVQVWLKGQYEFKGHIRATKEILLGELDVFTAYLDTGYSLQETKDLLIKMYPGTDWTTQRLIVLVIENIEWWKPY